MNVHKEVDVAMIEIVDFWDVFVPAPRKTIKYGLQKLKTSLRSGAASIAAGNGNGNGTVPNRRVSLEIHRLTDNDNHNYNGNGNIINNKNERRGRDVHDHDHDHAKEKTSQRTFLRICKFGAPEKNKNNNNNATYVDNVNSVDDVANAPNPTTTATAATATCTTPFESFSTLDWDTEHEHENIHNDDNYDDRSLSSVSSLGSSSIHSYSNSFYNRSTGLASVLEQESNLLKEEWTNTTTKDNHDHNNNNNNNNNNNQYQSSHNHNQWVTKFKIEVHKLSVVSGVVNNEVTIEALDDTDNCKNTDNKNKNGRSGSTSRNRSRRRTKTRLIFQSNQEAQDFRVALENLITEDIEIQQLRNLSALNLIVDDMGNINPNNSNDYFQTSNNKNDDDHDDDDDDNDDDDNDKNNNLTPSTFHTSLSSATQRNTTLEVVDETDEAWHHFFNGTSSNEATDINTSFFCFDNNNNFFQSARSQITKDIKDNKDATEEEEEEESFDNNFSPSNDCERGYQDHHDPESETSIKSCFHNQGFTSATSSKENCKSGFLNSICPIIIQFFGISTGLAFFVYTLIMNFILPREDDIHTIVIITLMSLRALIIAINIVFVVSGIHEEYCGANENSLSFLEKNIWIACFNFTVIVIHVGFVSFHLIQNLPSESVNLVMPFVPLTVMVMETAL